MDPGQMDSQGLEHQFRNAVIPKSLPWKKKEAYWKRGFKLMTGIKHTDGSADNSFVVSFMIQHFKAFIVQY